MILDEAAEAEGKRYACAEIIWDGPYRMTCSYMIVRDRCVRHGKNGARYEVPNDSAAVKPTDARG